MMPQTANDLVTRADIQAVITETAQRLGSRLKSDDFEQRVGRLTFTKLTQAEYDAIETPSESTVYIIVG